MTQTSHVMAHIACIALEYLQLITYHLFFKAFTLLFEVEPPRNVFEKCITMVQNNDSI